MPGTVLNVALPIKFHTRVIGALNIEWDEEHFQGGDNEVSDRYLRLKQPVLERLAQYFALVVDYFDDRNNETLDPPENIARQWEYVRSSTSRRRVLAYYVGSALRYIDAGLEERGKRDLISRRHYLNDIIDAVGYFLTFDNKRRVLASVRQRVHRSDGDALDLVYAHGFDPKAQKKDPKDLGPGGPIPIVAGESVLATCAVLGVAVFGRVKSGEFLEPDSLCEKCAPETDREILGRPVRYRPAGHRPVYEIGVPLVFGGIVLGTFDFELFSIGRQAREESAASIPPLAGYQLAPFLEWARAITFCMAYGDDSLDSESIVTSLGASHQGAFRRFQRLCAQIVANVAIPRDLLTPIAGEYIRGLIPVRELVFDPMPVRADEDIEPALVGGSTSSQAGVPVGEGPRDLWWRGEPLGTISMTLDSETMPPRSVFPETSLATGTSLLAQQFIGAFYTAALSAERGGDFDSSEFKAAVGSVQGAFHDQFSALRKDVKRLVHLGPHELIETCFLFLHQALRERLLLDRDGSTPRQPGRHGWFLYMAQCKELDLEERARLRCGRPFERWVSMRTREMKDLVALVLESSDPEVTLERILGQEIAEKILADWRARSETGDYTVDSLEEIFLEALARPGRDFHPDQRGDEAPGLTASTVLLKRVLSVIDLNRNPVRSDRKSGWFFGDEPYSIISVPVVFADRAIGVLQIFRRRDAIDDVLFFKNDEIEAVAQLGRALGDVIANEVECLSVQVLPSVASEGSFTHEVLALGTRLQQRVARQETPIVVSCDFRDEEEFYNRFLDHYVGTERKKFTTHELLQLKVDRLERMNLPIACVLYTGERSNSRLRERLAALTGRTGARSVILFVARDEESAVMEMLRSSAYLERQQRDARAEILRVAFGLAEGQEGNERETIGILFRRSGSWTIDQLAANSGETAGVIRNNAKIILKDFKDRRLMPRRLFPDWYEFSEGFGPRPRRPSPEQRGGAGRLSG